MVSIIASRTAGLPQYVKMNAGNSILNRKVSEDAGNVLPDPFSDLRAKSDNGCFYGHKAAVRYEYMNV